MQRKQTEQILAKVRQKTGGKLIHNAEAQWGEMNPQKYLKANYITILEPDREILETHLAFYKENPPRGDFLEVGCGPGRYPLY